MSKWKLAIFFFVLVLNIKVFMLKNVFEKPRATPIRPQGGPDGKLVRTCNHVDEALASADAPSAGRRGPVPTQGN